MKNNRITELLGSTALLLAIALLINSVLIDYQFTSTQGKLNLLRWLIDTLPYIALIIACYWRSNVGLWIIAIFVNTTILALALHNLHIPQLLNNPGAVYKYAIKIQIILQLCFITVTWLALILHIYID